MTKIVNTNETAHEVEILVSRFDKLKKWADNCHCIEIEKRSFIRYVVHFTNSDDMEFFANGAKANCY